MGLLTAALVCTAGGCTDATVVSENESLTQEEEVTDKDNGEDEETTMIGDLTTDCFKTEGNNNPIVTQRYSADPGVMVYEDTVYIYSTNDVYQYSGEELGENTYSKITTINCFGSTDLVNWTDYGAIAVAGKDGAATWANNSWAPCAAHKTIDGKEKFFLYFADNGSGIGVLTSDSPTGPFTDPLGTQLISRKTTNCADVTWLFDPAVMVDDDGSAYLVFGGGVPEGKQAAPGTARIVKLGDDMISLDGDPVAIDVPYLFEDSGINKIGDKYVYSYCSNFNCADGFESGTINYMVSDNPMGPYTYAGQILKNPASFFNDGNGNNHHSIFEFKGKYYIAYHARALEKAAVGKALGYRSTQIDEMTVEDGVIQPVTGTMTGVSQIKNLNPYELQKATTIYRQKGVEVYDSGDTVLTVTSGDFSGVKNVEFGKGPASVCVTLKADEDMTIELRVMGENGNKIATLEVTNTNGEYKTFTTEVSNAKGTKDLYFIYNGSAEIKDWIFTEREIEVEETKDATPIVDERPDGIETDVPDLKDAITKELADEDFIVGTSICLNELSDESLMALVTKHFNAITFGNELKPDSTFNYSNNTCPGPHYEEFNGEQLLVPTVNFDRGDKLLEWVYNYNQENPDNQIKIRGHVLTWHSQTPEWFFHEDYDASKPDVDKETMTKRHEWYIKTVLEHYVGEDSKYKDLFYGWDVVNEAVSDSTGTYRNADENSSWWRIYESNEYIINAFKFANKYAPADIDLYYNDYNEFVTSKVKGIAQLLTDVKNAEGTRIDGFGMQGHYSIDGGATKEEFLTAARTYAKIVDKLMLTEMDFKCSSKYDGTGDTYDEEDIRLAKRYLQIYEAVKELRSEGIDFSGITLWGVVDKNSWLQSQSNVGGGASGNKKQMPLLFNDWYHTKKAFWALVNGKVE